MGLLLRFAETATQDSGTAQIRPRGQGKPFFYGGEDGAPGGGTSNCSLR